jgi:branched-chain amino acid transport system substrate-binding protein
MPSEIIFAKGNTMRHRLLVSFAITGTLLAFNNLHAEEIKIGMLYPITGGGAIYGSPAQIGHRMGVEEINLDGGLLGLQAISVERDTKLNPATAAAAAKEMITKDGVNVLIGGLSSSVGLAVSEVARQEKVIYIATIAKTIQMTTNKRHNYVFRTASHTDFEGDAMAQIAQQLNAKSICDIQLDYAYGHDLAAGIEKGLAKHLPDTKIVLSLRPKLRATDYNVFITQIMGAGCDVVTGGLWGPHFVDFAKQATPFGLFQQIKFIAGGEIGSHEIASTMGRDYPDNVWANSYELWYHHPNEEHKKFHSKLSAQLGTHETTMWPVLAVIGVRMYAAAVRQAGSLDPDLVAEALRGMSIDTPVGPRTIDPTTHQTDTGQFWGPMVKKEGVPYRVMDPITYIPALLSE